MKHSSVCEIICMELQDFCGQSFITFQEAFECVWNYLCEVSEFLPVSINVICLYKQVKQVVGIDA